MTNEQLNRRIAEEVMGWEQYTDTEGRPGWGDPSDRIPLRRVDRFEPSLDIRDAWLVVEEMRRLGLTIELYLLSNSTWDCWIYSNDGFTAGYIENEKSVEIAICLAALEAVEQKGVVYARNSG